jgi:peroxiredoxin
MTTLTVGAKAPPFALAGIDGQPYTLVEALPQGPLLLAFFKTGCPACDLAAPYLVRLAAAYPGAWQLWLVLQDPPAEAGGYARRFSLPFPVFADGDGYRVSRVYDPPATPSFYLIEADGSVAHASHGFSKDDLNELAGHIARRLGAERQVVAPPNDGQPPLRPG